MATINFEKIVRNISDLNNEPDWMLRYRLNALDIFKRKELPEWSPDLSWIDFNKINYYHTHADTPLDDWEKVPEEFRQNVSSYMPDKPAGIGVQYDSGFIFMNLKKEWQQKGVIFTDTHTALREYPELFKEHFSKLVQPDESKFLALNSAVWSGGAFLYIPKYVHVDVPMYALFRISSAFCGQFPRSLIIADEGSTLNCISKCTAPAHANNSIYSTATEVFVKKKAKVSYLNIQDLPPEASCFAFKRMNLDTDSKGEWIDKTLGSKSTMAYPSIVLKGDNSKAELRSISMTRSKQFHDIGGKVIHLGKNTSSRIISKSVSREGSRAIYRGLTRIEKGARNSKAFTKCDALLVDPESSADSYPTSDVSEQMTNLGHEASINKVSSEQMFYLMSRGLKEEEALSLIVDSFLSSDIDEMIEQIS